MESPHALNEPSLIGLCAFDSMNAIDSFGERFRSNIKLTRVYVRCGRTCVASPIISLRDLDSIVRDICAASASDSDGQVSHGTWDIRRLSIDGYESLFGLLVAALPTDTNYFWKKNSI